MIIPNIYSSHGVIWHNINEFYVGIIEKYISDYLLILSNINGASWIRNILKIRKIVYAKSNKHFLILGQMFYIILFSFVKVFINMLYLINNVLIFLNWLEIFQVTEHTGSWTWWINYCSNNFLFLYRLVFQTIKKIFLNDPSTFIKSRHMMLQSFQQNVVSILIYFVRDNFCRRKVFM